MIDYPENLQLIDVKPISDLGHGTTHSGYGTTSVACRGGNRYVEGDLFTFRYLVLDDAFGYPYYRLINVE